MSIVKICCKLFSFSPLKRQYSLCRYACFLWASLLLWNGIIRSQLVYIVIGRLLCSRGRTWVGRVGIGSLALE